MQSMNPGGVSKRFTVSFCAALVGASGFLFSLVLACQILRSQGNAGFLLIWLLALAAAIACMRINRKWGEAFERMYAPRAPRPIYAGRTEWRSIAEEVVFREISSASAL